MKLTRGRDWLRYAVAGWLAVLMLTGWSGVAAAQTPIRARISIDGSKTTNTDEIQYTGVRLPDGSITDFNHGSFNVAVGTPLKLEVQFAQIAEWFDVTTDTEFFSAAEFFSQPEHVFNAHIFVLGQEGGSFKVFGSFTHDGVTVTDSLTIKPRFFKAPRFVDMGAGQAALLQEIDALAQAIAAWASGAGVSAEAALGTLARIRVFVEIWWSGKLPGPVAGLGGELVGLGAPPELLIQLSQLVVSLNSKGLMRFISFEGETEEGEIITITEFHETFAYPDWLPEPHIFAAVSPPITVFWFGLG